MKITKHWAYDYQNKCDCSDDDNCGCSYPENMERNFSPCHTDEKHTSTQSSDKNTK